MNRGFSGVVSSRKPFGRPPSTFEGYDFGALPISGKTGTAQDASAGGQQGRLAVRGVRPERRPRDRAVGRRRGGRGRRLRGLGGRAHRQVHVHRARRPGADGAAGARATRSTRRPRRRPSVGVDARLVVPGHQRRRGPSPTDGRSSPRPRRCSLSRRSDVSARRLDWSILLTVAGLCAIGLTHHLLGHRPDAAAERPRPVLLRPAPGLLHGRRARRDGARRGHRLPAAAGVGAVLLRRHHGAAARRDRAGRGPATAPGPGSCIGPFQLQPSEFAKVTLVLVLAAFVASDRGEELPFHGFVAALGSSPSRSLIVIAQPDLGTASVFVAITMAILLVAKANPRHIALVTASPCSRPSWSSPRARCRATSSAAPDHVRRHQPGQQQPDDQGADAAVPAVAARHRRRAS